MGYAGHCALGVMTMTRDGRTCRGTRHARLLPTSLAWVTWLKRNPRDPRRSQRVVGSLRCQTPDTIQGPVECARVALDLTADLTGFVLRAVSPQPAATSNVARARQHQSEPYCTFFPYFPAIRRLEPALSIFTHLTFFLFVFSNPFHIPFRPSTAALILTLCGLLEGNRSPIRRRPL